VGNVGNACRNKSELSSSKSFYKPCRLKLYSCNSRENHRAESPEFQETHCHLSSEDNLFDLFDRNNPNNTTIIIFFYTEIRIAILSHLPMGEL
jgi:hypothetical protein